LRYTKGDLKMNKIRKLKAKFAHEMDIFIRENIDDEDLIEIWLTEGVPDGADEDYLYDLLECPGVWDNICKYFGYLCAAFGLLNKERW
jgi:hypothetical protein